MKQFFSSIAYAAVVVVSTLAQTTPASSQLRIISERNPNLCVGVTSATLQAEVLLKQCGTANTTFNGAVLGNAATDVKFELVSNATGPGTPVPFLCITARESQAGTTPLVLDTCEDDKFENWQIVAHEGTDEVISLAPSNGTFCLTAAGNNEGAAVEYRACTGNSVSQQWTTVVVSN